MTNAKKCTNKKEAVSTETTRTARRRDFLINAAYVLCVLVAVWVVARWLWHYLLPLVLALPTAAALQRPRRWLEKRLAGGSRAAASVLTGLLFTLLAALLAAVVWGVAVWLAGDPADALWRELGELAAGLGDTIARWEEALGARLTPAAADTFHALRAGLQESVPQALSTWLTKMAGAVASAAVTRLPSVLLSALFYGMATAALTVEYDAVWAFLLRQLPVSRQQTVQAARTLCKEAVWRLARAYALLLGVTFAELLLGFLVLGIPRAALLAGGIALVDILPVLGAGAALLPWGAVCLLAGDTTRGIGLLLLWGSITTVRRVLEPRVVGQQMGLPPLVMLAVMLLGLRLAGFSGLLLFPVAAMLLCELHRHGYVTLWK